MDVLYERCCGLDVHKRTIEACVLTPGADGPPTRHQRRFGTMTRDVQALATWLADLGVTHVALESTGVYWQPVWNLLEGQFTLLLVNPTHIKAVPGRKSDVKDAAWIAELLCHGLLAGSVVPDRAQRELQELTRYRSELIHARTAEVNRLQKTLEGANLKLASIVSDLTGVSASAMLAALAAGETDPIVLAGLARGSLAGNQASEAPALSGEVHDHQRFMLGQHLSRLAGLDVQIAAVSAEIERRLAAQEMALANLDSVPGVGRWTAEVILSELGSDLDRFPDAAHLSSWAGMCPGQDESAGKHRSRHARKGRPALRVALTEAAYAAGRTKHGVLGERYRRLAHRRGRKRAALAVGRTILEVCYDVLTTGAPYYEPSGPDPALRRARTERRLVRALERLGNTVQLTPLAP
jgi:transposase